MDAISSNNPVQGPLMSGEYSDSDIAETIHDAAEDASAMLSDSNSVRTDRWQTFNLSGRSFAA